MTSKSIAIIITFLLMIIVSIFCVCKSQVTIPPNHTGVMTSHGIVQNEPLSEGRHRKTIFDSSIAILPNTIQTYQVAAGTNQATTTETAETADQQLIPVYDFEIQYQLMPEFTVQVFKNYGSQYADTLIGLNATSAVKKVFSEYNSEDIVKHKSDIPVQITEILNEITQPVGVTVIRANMKNYDFTPEYTALLEERAMLKAKIENDRIKQQEQTIVAQTEKDVAVKNAEREAETARIATEKDKEVALIKAQTEAETKIIESNNAKEIARISAESKAETNRIEAENKVIVANADRDARLAAVEATRAELEAQSVGLTELMVQKILAERWNGELPITFGTSSYNYSNLTDIMKYFIFDNVGGEE